MPRTTIKKGDTVQIIAGKERGKRGTIEQVIPSRDRVVVAGLNMVKRHLKPTRTNPRGGIVEKPASLHRSNVMLVCPQTDKPTRVSHQIGANGVKNRTSKAGVNLDNK
jgi:large subunit ribosomal protein L24